MHNNFIALLWGLAESIVFFIVPDVWFSIVGREHLRAGLIACIYGLAGALIGGAMIYHWGVLDFDAGWHVIERVPAISPAMMARVDAEVAQNSVMAILMGPLRGTPYKAYALHAAQHGIGPVAFVLISIPARLFRFLLVTIAFHYAVKGLQRLGMTLDPLYFVASAWVVFYLFYFLVMPG